MKSMVRRLLRRWGSVVELISGESRQSFRAVLEPTTSLSWQNMRRQVRDLGELPPGQFLYMGEVDLSGAEYLLRDGNVYIPRRCEAMRLGGETLFYWGLAIPAGEEDPWMN